MLDTLLGELAGELHTVRGIFEDDNWGDDDSLTELKRIMALSEGAVRSATQSLHRHSALEKLKANT
jgi:hypothetical protein